MTAAYQPSLFGCLLHDYRKRAGLTQIQLADISTVSVRAIRDLELGSAKRPRRETVRLLADALRLSARRRVNFEMAAGRDAATAAFEAVSGARSAPPPQPAGPMYGREHERRALTELMISGTQRLVAVTGLAGVGKTRLALAVAHELHETGRLRILWLSAADLGSVTDAQRDRRPHAAESLTGWIRPLLSPADGRLSELADLIADTALLLVLDDLDAAGWPTGRELLELLSCCPNLRIVLTGCSSAEVAGAYPFPVRPLPVVDSSVPSAGGYCAAVEVLAWHLRSVRPELLLTPAHTEQLTRLSWWLDGIPGALIGAAAWSLLTPLSALADLAEHDPFAVAVPPAGRHARQPLQEGLEQLIDALGPVQRSVLEALAGLGLLPMAEVAVVTGYSLAETAHVLHALVTRDLVRVSVGSDGENRFCVLNTVSSLLTATSLAASM